MILVIFLLGFGQSFFIIFGESGFTPLVERINSCVLVMLGTSDINDYMRGRFPALSVGILLLYIILVGILLLNLLIAMMGDTFARISDDAEKQWHLEWARYDT